MFDPKKAAKFFGRMLALLAPILLLLLVLGLVTELWGRLADWRSLLGSGPFWLGVLRDMLPGSAALLGVYLLATSFVRALYGIGSHADARSFLHHRLFGQFKFGPWLRVQEGALEGGEGHVLTTVGGRGQLVIYNDSAVILQHAGQFTRFHDASAFANLESFEKLYDAVDLRPIRKLHTVEAMSSEGIPVSCEVDLRYQIENDGAQPTQSLPFPTSQARVLQAVAGRWIRGPDDSGKPSSLDWSERLSTFEADVILRSILARYPLDGLVLAPGGSGGSVRDPIRQELQHRLDLVAPKLGARILKVELGDIRVKDEVTRQWLEAWQAHWESFAMERQAEGRAKAVRHVEDAKTRAQAAMIRSITGVLRSLTTGADKVTSKIILARLCMALSRATDDPLTRVYLPQEAVNTLTKLKDLVL